MRSMFSVGNRPETSTSAARAPNSSASSSASEITSIASPSDREEQVRRLVDQPAAADLDAPVEPRHEHLGEAADDERRREPVADVATAGGDEVGHGEARLDAATVERLVAERLDVQDTAPPAVRVDEAHGARHRRPHDVLERRRLGHRLLDLDAQLDSQAVVHGDDQRVEVVEALVEVPRVE